MIRPALLAISAVSLASPALAQPALPDRPISRTEISAAVKAKFAQIDTNHDGVVSRAEFEAFRARMASGDVDRGNGAAAFVHIGGHWFERSDANGDGRVTLAEATGRPLEMFDMADTNHDGVVSLQERKLAMMLMSLK